MTRIRVWDLPTRVFHWLLAALVLVAYFTAEGEGTTHQVHVACGYGVGVLILFRILWGVAGTRYARFDTFLRTLRDLPGYVPRLIQLRPDAYLGHNPLGVLAVFAMIGVLGLVLYSGVYGGEELHETAGNLIIILAAIHVAGVIADSVLTGDNLVMGMITGRKRHAEGMPDAGPEVPPMRAAWRSLGAAALTAIVTVFSFTQSQALKWAPPMEHEMEEHEGEAHEGGEYGEHEEYEDYE
jgi:cytochrome b